MARPRWGYIGRASGCWIIPANKFDPRPSNIRKFHFGLKTDIPVVPNWGHAGRADHAGVFRDGLWYVDVNGDGKYDPKDDGLYPFGLPGDIPVVVNCGGARRSAYIVVDYGSWTETGTTATMRTTWYSRTGARETS